MPCYIEEGGPIKAFSDLIGIIKNGYDDAKYKKDRNNGASLTVSSINRAARDLVLSFPVLCSDTITPETAMLITKAVERNCVTTLQLLFSASYLKGRNGQEVIAKWHKNMNTDMGMDEYLAMSDTITQATSGGKIAKDLRDKQIQDTLDQIFSTEGTVLRDRFLASIDEGYPQSSFKSSSILEYSIYDRGYGEPDIHHDNIFNEVGYDSNGNFQDELGAIHTREEMDSRRAYDKEEREKRREARDIETFNMNKQKTYHDSNLADVEARQTKEKNAADYQMAQQRLAIDKQEYDLKDKQFAYQKNMDNATRADFFNKQLMDSDVKKANELVPSMIIVRYTIQDPDNNQLETQDFIAGVKARMIPVPSGEIISNIAATNKTKPNMLNFVRATTGEISFAKDFVMSIDQAKIDAKNNTRISKTSPIWRALQARATKSVYKRASRKANDASAITTLVITNEEVNLLKNQYKIDLDNAKVAKDLMETYNLLGLVIVNDEVEVARFLLDGESYYQDYSYSSLEKETGDGSYKKVVNLLSKVSR
jgi:hypothetical protein